MPKTDWFVSTKTPWVPGKTLQMVGRGTRLPHNKDDFLTYLRTGRIFDWSRLNDVYKYMAEQMLIDGEAKLIEMNGRKYLAYRHRWFLSFLTMGLKS